jgi:hypothetical protein
MPFLLFHNHKPFGKDTKHYWSRARIEYTTPKTHGLQATEHCIQSPFAVMYAPNAMVQIATG